MEWEARRSGGMKEAAVLIQSGAVVPQAKFARHIRHIPGGSELYRAEVGDSDTVLLLYRSGSGRTETATEVGGELSFDSWDAAEQHFGLPEGALNTAFCTY